MARYELTKEDVEIITQFLNNASIRVQDAPRVLLVIHKLKNPVTQKKEGEDERPRPQTDK